MQTVRFTGISHGIEYPIVINPAHFLRAIIVHDEGKPTDYRKVFLSDGSDFFVKDSLDDIQIVIDGGLV